jgi:dienelactone hydrolase
MNRTAALVTCSVLSGALLVPGDAASQNAPLWGKLNGGSYDVGFRRLWDVDVSRVWPRSKSLDSLTGEIGRPIRVDVWFPADCGGERRMPLSSYVSMEPPSPVFEDLAFLTRRWDEYSYRGLAGDSSAFDRLMATQTAACWEARAAAGRFPIVVYSAGWFNRAPDNTILAEFLASHGFVVAAVPQLNPGLWTFNFRSDAQSVENQVRDLEVALALLTRQPFVDRRRVAAMGYSTGGDVALLLQARSPIVDAVVGLDASWTLGPGNDVEESPFFMAHQHTVPILVTRRPTAGRASANAVLDSLTRAPRLVVDVPGADHGSFSDDPPQRSHLGVGTAEQQQQKPEVAQAVLEFLRATLISPGVFAGAELERQYTERGLAATYRPPVKDNPTKRPEP